MLQAHEGELCGRSSIHSALVVMGLFRGQLHARPIIQKKRKRKKRTTQWTKSA